MKQYGICIRSPVKNEPKTSMIGLLRFFELEYSIGWQMAKYLRRYQKKKKNRSDTHVTQNTHVTRNTKKIMKIPIKCHTHYKEHRSRTKSINKRFL